MIHYVLRSIHLEDLDDLKELTEGMRDGVASLPNNRDILAKRIELSQRSFGKKKVSAPGKEFYFFALENVVTGKVVGVCGIEARIGDGKYFVYEKEKEIFESEALKVSNAVEVLKPRLIKKGPSELCSLYLSPRHRVQGLGKLLSLGRFLFINNFEKRFDEGIIANLRGYRDREGRSPFWETIGEVFFDGNLSRVDMMKSFGRESFIKDLMPRHPLYIPLLPKKAQAVIGKVHPKTRPALYLLVKQGFKVDKWFDILDAGPYAYAKRKDVNIIRNIKRGRVSRITKGKGEMGTGSFLISNNSLDFRACIGEVVRKRDGSFVIDEGVAEALRLREGSGMSCSRL